MLLLTRAGEHGALWYALAGGGALLDRASRRSYLRAAAAVAAAQIANTLIKLVVRRERPLFEDLPALAPTLSSRSYPSAHAATSFAAARTLSAALPSGLLYGLALVISLSRPYLGVHYPSDVVAGAALGDGVARLLA